MGFECSAIRHYGKSTDRAIGIAWKAIGWFATADRDRGLPSHGCLTRATSGARSKRDGTERCGDRHVRHPPFQHSADRVPAASEGVKSLRTICAGRSVRLGTHAVSYAAIARCNPGAQPNLGSAIRTGWCRRRAVNAVPAGKRFDSVHFPPIASKTGVSALMADVAGRS
jgi:hypothetical protein